MTSFSIILTGLHPATSIASCAKLTTHLLLCLSYSKILIHCAHFNLPFLHLIYHYCKQGNSEVLKYGVSQHGSSGYFIGLTAVDLLFTLVRSK